MARRNSHAAPPAPVAPPPAEAPPPPPPPAARVPTGDDAGPLVVSGALDVSPLEQHPDYPNVVFETHEEAPAPEAPPTPASSRPVDPSADCVAGALERAAEVVLDVLLDSGEVYGSPDAPEPSHALLGASVAKHLPRWAQRHRALLDIARELAHLTRGEHVFLDEARAKMQRACVAASRTDKPSEHIGALTYVLAPGLLDTFDEDRKAIQEAIEEALKHGQGMVEARRIALRLIQEQAMVCLLIDRAGLDP